MNHPTVETLRSGKLKSRRDDLMVEMAAVKNPKSRRDDLMVRRHPPTIQHRAGKYMRWADPDHPSMEVIYETLTMKTR